MNKKSCLILLLISITLSINPAWAQVQHFIYLEAAKPVTFTVRANQQTLTSSAKGYLIIPRLPAGSLDLRLHMPGSEPVQYQIAVERDAGYLLRQESSGAWALYDMVRFTKIPQAEELSKTGEGVAGRTEVPVPAGSVAQSETVARPTVPEPALIPVITENMPVRSVPETAGDSGIRVLNRELTEKNIRFQYLISGKDTVDVVLAGPSIQPATPVPAAVEKPEAVVPEKTVVLPVSEPAPVVTTCAEAASSEDIKKYRQELMALEGEGAQLEYIRKSLPCLRTDQAAGLVALFKTDRGRYEFFDLAYPKTVDPGSFHLLEQFLKDEYYIKRFRAILR